MMRNQTILNIIKYFICILSIRAQFTNFLDSPRKHSQKQRKINLTGIIIRKDMVIPLPLNAIFPFHWMPFFHDFKNVWRNKYQNGPRIWLLEIDNSTAICINILMQTNADTRNVFTDDKIYQNKILYLLQLLKQMSLWQAHNHSSIMSVYREWLFLLSCQGLDHILISYKI